MSKYAEQDSQILGLVNSGITRYGSLVQASGLDDRLVDRRLQAMKKAGKLSFCNAVGWALREEAAK